MLGWRGGGCQWRDHRGLIIFDKKQQYYYYSREYTSKASKGEIEKMPGTKYGKHVIREPYNKAAEDFGNTSVFTYNDDDKAGVTFEYHCINNLDWAIKESRKHNTHQLLCFLGGNPKNITDLGAEVSLHLGDINEEHVFNDAVVVSVPPGLKYGPISVNKYSSPFVLLRIVNTKEYQDKLNAEAGGEEIFSAKTLLEGSDTPKYGKKYWMNMVRGPYFVDYEPGWVGTSIWSHHNEYKNGTTLGYHCITSEYYVHYNHAHEFHEMLCFLGGDPENVGDLGAEVSMCLGEEQEKQVFNTPAIISMPPDLRHCPLLVKNVTKPLVFLEVSVAKDFKAKPDKKGA
jgi:hypothetical protein